MSVKPIKEDLLLPLQESFPCAYFADGRISSIEYLYADEEDAQRFHEFLARGYRRLGSLFYRNVCTKCTDCKPLRLETGRFILSRSQRRTLRRNRDIRLEIQSPSRITDEKIDLYRRYIDSKHSGEAVKKRSGITRRSLPISTTDMPGPLRWTIITARS